MLVGVRCVKRSTRDRDKEEFLSRYLRALKTSISRF